MSYDRLADLERQLDEASRTQQDLEKRMFHLKTVYDISREICGLLDSAKIIDTLLMMTVGTFGVERGVVVVIDVKQQRIEHMAHRGFDAPEVPVLAQLAESIPMNDDTATFPLMLAAQDGDNAFGKLGLQVWLPFRINDRLCASVGVGAKLTGEIYTADDIELLATLANHGAMGIKTAAAHEELVRYAQELTDSLARIRMLESIKRNLAHFVPRAVQALIEESPEAPALEKRETDVSVLFVDITGYTRLSAQLDLERVNQLVEVYFGACLDEIVKHGGDVNETAGDGLMVIFRDPDPCRHAIAAATAAVGIQRRTAEVNATLEGYFDPIAMHVGINSGIAAVGVTKIEGAAGARWTYTASGPTTNLAARIAALGDAGVIISETTRNRLGDAFETEDLGMRTLKNVSEPVRVYRLRTDSAL